MGKKDERKFENLHKLIQLLLNHPEGLTKAEIGRHLNVHRSTAGEYIDSLESISVPVYEVVPNRYTIDREHYQVQISDNIHESLALHLATRLLTTRTDKHYPHAASALRKLGVALEELAPLISKHMKLSADVLDGNDRKRDSAFIEVLETLTIAWANRTKVRVTHEMDDGQTYAYIFSPYFIEPYAVGRTMHIIGYREPPGAIRTFKIERIRTARLLSENYTIPPDFDPTLFLKDAWGIWFTEDKPQKVVLRFSPRVSMRVKETLWHHTQQINLQNDGFLIWKAYIADWQEMLPWIRGWGADCEVVEPNELRQALENEARRLGRLYSVQSDLEQNKQHFYAHSRPDLEEREWQPLKDHLVNTSKIAAQMGKHLQIMNLARIAGLLHDIGKYAPKFQERLRGSSSRVDHATAGAREIMNLFPNQPIAEVISYCIAGHHTGLPDYGSLGDLPNTGTLLARREKKNIEDYSAYKTEIDLSGYELSQLNNIRAACFRFGDKEKKYPGFSTSFLTRMLFSILVDADWLETEQFISNKKITRGQHESIQSLTRQFNHYVQRFENPMNEINRKRTETLHTCIKRSENPPGFFTLTVPTGGGKTLSSMAFALNHAVKHNLRRVIYVIPFTSIIEQNAAVFRESLGEFGDENVLEHHSNFDWAQKFREDDDETNSVLQKLKLAAENWDVPIVVTTNVQFFESLFANKKRQARKLHNISKSVIIFDEVQTLPLQYLQPSLLAVQELVQNYGCSVVFCTATQPSLQRFFPKHIQFTELAPTPQKLFEFYKRVDIKYIDSVSDQELIKQLSDHKQVLCIVNTRRHARGLFEAINGNDKFHLSTLMCPMHRKSTLNEIRQRLANGQPCRVISTQVMEAGIDIDFPIGFRSIAGLDSIIQAAGRINREMKFDRGKIFVFSPETEFIKRTPTYIKQTAAVTKKILREHKDSLDSIDAIEAYFNLLYNLQSNENFDSRGIMYYFEKGTGQLDFDFKTAAENFKLIEQITVPVIIPYDDTAKKLISQLEELSYPVNILRRLQLYTVNIYENELKQLQSKGVILSIAGTYHVLDWKRMNDFYHPYTGLIIPERAGGEAVFFD